MKKLTLILLATSITIVAYCFINYTTCFNNNSNTYSSTKLEDSTLFKIKLLQSIPKEILIQNSENLGVSKESIQFIGKNQKSELIGDVLIKFIKIVNSTSELRIKSVIINNDLPLRKVFVQKLEKDFTQNYKNTINLNILDSNISVKWNDIKGYFDTSEISNSIDSGIGFFYSIHTTENGTYFNYLLCQAIWDPINHQVNPIPKNPNNNFPFLTIESPFIAPTTFPDFQTNHSPDYKNTIKVLQPYSSGSNRTVSIDTINHTLACFYSGKRFVQFYNDNKDLCGDTSRLYLTITNGCTNEMNFASNSGKKLILEPQVPILFFQQGIASDSAFLNNNDHSRATDGTFTNRALDVGRLCPPQCD